MINLEIEDKNEEENERNGKNNTRGRCEDSKKI